MCRIFHICIVLITLSNLILQTESNAKVEEKSNLSDQKSEDESEPTANDSAEEFEVEEILDYKWCRATVRSQIFMKREWRILNMLSRPRNRRSK